MKKFSILLVVFLCAIPFFASGKKDKTVVGRIALFGSAPVDVFAGLVTNDGKQYTLDASEIGLSLEEFSALQGYVLECSGTIIRRKKAALPVKSLKDGVFVLHSYKMRE